MAKWLESGTRRDLCVLLYAGGELRAQELKRRLEDHHDERVRPKQFYGRLDALVSTGHVEKRVDGLHDVYSLTEAGERALERHYEWMRERIESQDG